MRDRIRLWFSTPQSLFAVASRWTFSDGQQFLVCLTTDSVCNDDFPDLLVSRIRGRPAFACSDQLVSETWLQVVWRSLAHGRDVCQQRPRSLPPSISRYGCLKGVSVVMLNSFGFDPLGTSPFAPHRSSGLLCDSSLHSLSRCGGTKSILS